MYKIGLVSAHGAGKTALAGSVESKLKARGVKAKRIEESSEKADERGLPINEESTLESQLWILFNQFREEVKYSSPKLRTRRYDVIICDRGPDNYCYLQNRCGPDEYALMLTLGFVRKYPYNGIYLLPITESIIDEDHFRSTDREWQQEMYREIKSFLVQYQIPHCELPQPAPEDENREIWNKIIVNQTLKDLGLPQKLYLR